MGPKPGMAMSPATSATTLAMMNVSSADFIKTRLLCPSVVALIEDCNGSTGSYCAKQWLCKKLYHFCSDSLGVVEDFYNEDLYFPGSSSRSEYVPDSEDSSGFGK